MALDELTVAVRNFLTCIVERGHLCASLPMLFRQASSHTCLPIPGLMSLLCASAVAGGKCHSYEWRTSGWRDNERSVWCQRSDGVNVTGTAHRPSYCDNVTNAGAHSTLHMLSGFFLARGSVKIGRLKQWFHREPKQILGEYKSVRFGLQSPNAAIDHGAIKPQTSQQARNPYKCNKNTFFEQNEAAQCSLTQKGICTERMKAFGWLDL